MSINPLFDKLYAWIRSELDWDPDFFGQTSGPRTPGRKDPDLEAAEEELEEFLRGGKSGSESRRSGSWSGGSWSEDWGSTQGSGPQKPQDRAAVALAQAYLELGLSPGATWEDVKEAQRSLLRRHHPDRHGPDKKAVEEATKKTQRINEAYQIIKQALGKS